VAVSGCTSEAQSEDVPHQDPIAGASAQPWPYSSQLEMAPLTTAVACGRLHTRSVLLDWGLGQAIEDGLILVSELLTNSVKASGHQGTPVRLRLLSDRRQFVIEAWDHNLQPPQQRRANYADESGRGLNVIAALAVRWGYYRSGQWKVVWAEMLTRSAYQRGDVPGGHSDWLSQVPAGSLARLRDLRVVCRYGGKIISGRRVNEGADG
jgi:anti-sigma regulatory factor (Ser/Thr protein kinase)